MHRNLYFCRHIQIYLFTKIDLKLNFVCNIAYKSLLTYNARVKSKTAKPTLTPIKTFINLLMYLQSIKIKFIKKEKNCKA